MVSEGILGVRGRWFGFFEGEVEIMTFWQRVWKSEFRSKNGLIEVTRVS